MRPGTRPRHSAAGEAARGRWHQLSSVASDITDVSGRLMLQALIDGRRDPAALADLAKRRLRTKIPELTEALTGRNSATIHDHHAFLAGLDDGPDLVSVTSSVTLGSGAMTDQSGDSSTGHSGRQTPGRRRNVVVRAGPRRNVSCAIEDRTSLKRRV